MVEHIMNNFDLCVISFSDLTNDARSSNFIEFNRNNNLKIATISISNSVEIINIPNLIFKVNQHSRFLFNWFKFLRFSRKKHNLVKSKIYFASDLYSLVIANLIKPKDSEVIYDSREIFSALGTLSKNSLKQKVWSFLEKINIRKVKDIVVSGELDAKYLSDYFQTQHNYHIIKNLPNIQPIVKTNYLRDLYNIPSDKFVLIYQGVILEGRGLLPTLKFLKTTDKFVIVLVGEGTYKSEITRIIKEEKLENKVYLHNQVPYNQLLSITASADIGLSLIEPISFSYTLAFPNKLFEYLLAGLPVLVSDLPAMTDFVNSTKIGEIVPIEMKPSQIEEKLASIINNLDYYKSNIQQNQPNYTYNSQSKNIISLLQSLYK